MTDQLPSDLAWNPDLALANVDGYLADLKELLGIWLRETPRLLSDIRDSLDHEHAKGLHLAAHTLRGGLYILGATNAASAAEALETSAASGQTVDGVELFSQLERELAPVTQQVTTFLNTH